MDAAEKEMIWDEEDKVKYDRESTQLYLQWTFYHYGWRFSDGISQRGKSERGTLHCNCNVQCRKFKDIPVFFHNLGGYDGHHFFQNLGKIEGIKEPEVIAKTMEKFVTFSIGHLKFKDSLQFLNSSLAKLVNSWES